MCTLYQRVGRLSILGWHWHGHAHLREWNGSELTVISLFRQITGSTSVSLPYKPLIVCKIRGYNDIWKVPHPHFGIFCSPSSSSVRTTYLKIGASICRGSFTKHLHLGVCMILDAQNRLSWSKLRYYIRGLWWWSAFSHCSITWSMRCRRGAGLVRHMRFWRI